MSTAEQSLSIEALELPRGVQLELAPRLTESTHDTSRAFVFEKNDERVLLAIPTIGIGLTLILWAFGRFGISAPVTDLHQYLSSIIFLDSVHIVFTFVLMATLPEMREWSKSKETREKTGWFKGLGPLARFAVMGTILGVIIWVIKVNPSTSTLFGMASVWLFFELLGPSHHTVSQMRGISFCYNSALRKKFKFSDEQKAMASKSEKMEKLFFNMLLASELLYWFPEIFRADKYIIPGIDSFQLIGASLAISAAVALVVNGLYFPSQDKSKKALFLTRGFLFPLKMLSIISALAIRATHGMEYLIVFRKMVRSSQISKPKKSRVFLIAGIVSAAYVIPFTVMGYGFLYKMTGFQASERMIAAAVIGTFILRYTHFYMDSVMFKMSDSATRAAVAPLLAADPHQITK
jgi:hypothetical protein